MPSLPSIPLSEVEPLSFNDPVLRSNQDNYIYQTRPRNIRTKRQFSIEWKGLTAAQKNVIERFIRNQRGSVLPFDWLYPFGQTIIDTTNTDPVVVTTQYAHNVLDYDHVVISGIVGTTSSNGSHQAHVLSATTFEIIGVAGNGSYVSGGEVQVFFPYMRLLLEAGEYKGSTKILGPDRDQYGVYSVSLVLEEIFF